MKREGKRERGKKEGGRKEAGREGEWRKKWEEVRTEGTWRRRESRKTFFCPQRSLPTLSHCGSRLVDLLKAVS